MADISSVVGSHSIAVPSYPSADSAIQSQNITPSTVLHPPSSHDDSSDLVSAQASSPEATRPSTETSLIDDESSKNPHDSTSYQHDPALAGARSPSSQSSSNLGKRRHSDDVEDSMKDDPALWGLRRSGRARPTRRVIESDSEEDSASHSGRATKRRKANWAKNTTKSASPAQQYLRPGSPSDSEQDADAYGGRRVRAQERKTRKKAPTSTPEEIPSRFSNRRANRITYNENDNDDEDLLMDDAEYDEAGYYAGEDAPPPVTWIDVVLDHRLKDETIKPKHPAATDFEYLIKWQFEAHYHATWNNYEYLRDRGEKKVKNYFTKIASDEFYYLNDPEASLDEKEIAAIDRLARLEKLEEYRHVERVVDSRPGVDGVEYYTKWKGLTYDFCTWESATLVSQLAQQEIDKLLDRTSRPPVLNKTECSLATRGPFKTLTEQPSYIKNGTLREFQMRGINFIAGKWTLGQNMILADEMGLGKTVQTVSTLSWLHHNRQIEGPFLVIVPLSTMPAWIETFDNWTPDLNYVVYTGNSASRAIIREKELFVNGQLRKTKFNVLITTYEFALEKEDVLSQIKWQMMAVDEAHRLKNDQSTLYTKLMAFSTQARLLITGTPVQNNLAELSALAKFLMPDQDIVDGNLDLQSATASAELEKLNSKLGDFILRRTKEEVERDLPPKTEQTIRVELANVQVKYYQNILTRNYAALTQGSNERLPSLTNLLSELKKTSNHPCLLTYAEPGIMGSCVTHEDELRALVSSSGKMMVLDRLLAKLRKDGRRVLIFSQMVQMLNILGQYLRLRNYRFQRLDGTTESSLRRKAIDHFNAPESDDFAFLLSTRAGGLGINLATADTVVIFDSDWNPQADLQAMARAHRIGQKKQVSVFRLISKGTIEEDILERARNKLILEYITIQSSVANKEERETAKKLVTSGLTDAPKNADDIDRILRRRGQKMFEQVDNQKKLEEMDIDAVLANAEVNETKQGKAIDTSAEFLDSFAYTDVKVDTSWDDIIPTEELSKIKEQEKERNEAAYLKKMIEQNQPRKRKAVADDEREQRAATKRARMLSTKDDDAGLSSESEPDLDPSRPLTVAEMRLLYQAHLTFGSIEDRPNDIVKFAKLEGRSLDVLKVVLKEIGDISEDKLKEETQRLNDIEKHGSKGVTKKEIKAIGFTYKDVKIYDASKFVDRPEDMRIIKASVESAPDFHNYRVEGATKPAEYTATWASKEDGMLVVGIHRYGWGSWTAIRDDSELQLSDKFYLEEHRVSNKQDRDKRGEKVARSPGAVHLQRRVQYLMQILRDKAKGGADPSIRKALENHHRNNKKQGHASQRSDLVNGASHGSRSPATLGAPGRIQKPARDSPRPSSSHNKYKPSRLEENDRQKSAQRISAGPRPNTSDSRPKEGSRLDKLQVKDRPSTSGARSAEGMRGPSKVNGTHHEQKSRREDHNENGSSYNRQSIESHRRDSNDGHKEGSQRHKLVSDSRRRDSNDGSREGPQRQKHMMKSGRRDSNDRPKDAPKYHNDKNDDSKPLHGSGSNRRHSNDQKDTHVVNASRGSPAERIFRSYYEELRRLRHQTMETHSDKGLKSKLIRDTLYRLHEIIGKQVKKDNVDLISQCWTYAGDTFWMKERTSGSKLKTAAEAQIARRDALNAGVVSKTSPRESTGNEKDIKQTTNDHAPESDAIESPPHTIGSTTKVNGITAPKEMSQE